MAVRVVFLSFSVEAVRQRPFSSTPGGCPRMSPASQNAVSVRVVGLVVGISTNRPHSTFGGKAPDEVYAMQADEEKLAA